MTRPRVLIVGVGNIFLADDAFGVEVVQRLTGRPLPEGAEVRDLGIGGLALVYALQEGHDGVILVDVLQRGGAPGTLYLFEPDPGLEKPWTWPGHNLDPASALRLAWEMSGRLPVLRLVGCEPARLDDEPGLSEPVQAAVGQAVELIETLLADTSWLAGRATE